MTKRHAAGPGSGLAFALTFAAWLAPAPAEAAVRLCHAAVSGGLHEARTEPEARALAISAWTSAASVHGQNFASWRLANSKFLNCSKTGAGAHQCLASAEPCIISNKPPPPGTWQPRTAPGISG